MRALLELAEVKAGYGDCQVLFGLNLMVREGEVVTLLGRNGVGKTTTVRTIMGLTPATQGSISLGGKAIRGLPPEQIANAGIALVPEGRQIFPNLTVTENLEAFARGTTGKNAWTIDRVLDFFPALAARVRNLGSQLSGGEQQMLAIGRAMLRNGRLLLVDEATEGLAPLIRHEIWRCLERLKSSGMAILLIDKYLEPLLSIGDRHYIMERGSVVWSGDSHALRNSNDIWERYVGV